MKNINLRLVCFVVFSFFSIQNVLSQFVEKSVIVYNQVPGKVQASFTDEFKDAKVFEWHKVGATTYDVVLKHQKTHYLVTYDWEGRKSGQYIKVKTGSLSKKQKESLKKKYEGLKIIAVYQYDKANNTFIVEGEVKGKLSQFKI